jgi:hypothetical protein
MFTTEVEQENSFVQRIKNKTKVLQMYSSSPANDLFYVGSSFDSSDYVDFSKIQNSELIPLIQNGEMTLPTKLSKMWVTQRVTIDQANSNGYSGNNHSVYQVSDIDSDYRYFFKDSPTSRNTTHAIDNNPITFFEYEQINVPQRPANHKQFEFEYAVPGGTNAPTVYSDWSKFSLDGKLKLTLLLENDSIEKANFIKVTPYFGSNNYISKDIIVSKIEVTNNRNEIENILPTPIYISSGFIPSSLDAAKSFYYREANIKFSERQVKSIKIYFEQENYTDTKIKHVYFRPVSTGSQSNPINVNPYYNQTRFDPEQPLLSSEFGYPAIPWQEKIYNKSQIVPLFNQPNLFKAEVSNTVNMALTLKRNIPVKSGWAIRAIGTNGQTYYLTNLFREKFDYEASATPRYGLFGYSGIDATTASGYFTVNAPSGSNGISDAWISDALDPSSINDAVTIKNQIVAWFNTTSQGATKEQKYAKFGLNPTIGVTAFETSTTQTKVQTKTYTVPLQRQYDILDAQRKSISIRDISVGYEEYADTAEIVSRPFEFNSSIEYVTISSESSMSGSSSSITNYDFINYYISLDNSTWIQISPIENSTSSVGEVLAFNQNVDDTFKIPGIEYFSAPSIPEDPRSMSVKIVLNKPSSENITPIVYSYKVGVKVKQI